MGEFAFRRGHTKSQHFPLSHRLKSCCLCISILPPASGCPCDLPRLRLVARLNGGDGSSRPARLPVLALRSFLSVLARVAHSNASCTPVAALRRVDARVGAAVEVPSLPSSPFSDAASSRRSSGWFEGGVDRWW